MTYDINGTELEVNNFGEFSEIPEFCPECGARQAQGEKIYTNLSLSIHKCLVCDTEHSIIT